ncbi:MAG: response regulator [Nitrospirae bacterium]|nr:response regulator [Nitrospirota bacterium]
MWKKTILLVEDDDVVREMIGGALERGYNVLEASKCSEALEKLGTNYDLALIDYVLPDGNGFDVLKRIREVDPGLPVIFITVYSTDNLAIKALRTGVTDYMKKPLSFSYLMGKLAKILEDKDSEAHQESAESREVFIMDSIAAFMESNYTEDLDRAQLAKKSAYGEIRVQQDIQQTFRQECKIVFE